MTVFRMFAIAGLLSVAMPADAPAASAAFLADLSGSLTIDAPGATIGIVPGGPGLPEFVDANLEGTGDVEIDPGLDADFSFPFDLFGGAVRVEVTGAAVAPFGLADVALLAGLGFDVTNGTGATIDVALAWDIAAMTDAEVSAMPGQFVDAFSQAFIGIYADFRTRDEPFAPEDPIVSVEAGTDPFFGPFGPQSDSDASSRIFAVAPRETLFVGVIGFATGFAEVAPVPLPASLGLVLTGLAGVAAVRLRSA